MASSASGNQRELQSSRKYSLPEYYTNVTPASLVTKQPVLQPSDVLPATDDNLLESAIADEHVWLEKTRKQRGGARSMEDPVSWAAYHGNLQTENRAPTINALLPRFQMTPNQLE